jgi:hypothetical protein
MLLQKLRDEVKMNRFLSEEKLSKTIKERRSVSEHMKRIIDQALLTEDDVVRMEKDNRELNSSVTAMIEKKMAASG